MTGSRLFGSLTAACLLTVAVLAVLNIHRHDGPVKVQQEIPDFPFPGDLTKLDRADLRANRWQLFVNLTSKKVFLSKKLKALSKPLWETWYTKCDLGLSPACDNQVSRNEKHIAFVGGSPQIEPSDERTNQRFSVVY